MCLFVVACSLIDRFTQLKITSIWIVEPLGFAYGIIAARHANSIRRLMEKEWLKKCGILMAISGALGIAYLRLKPIAIFGDYILKIALGISITLFIFEVLSKLRVGNKLIDFLGRISYEVYLLHYAAFVLLTMIDKDMNSGVFVVTAVTVTLALSYALNRICKPLERIFK